MDEERTGNFEIPPVTGRPAHQGNCPNVRGSLYPFHWAELLVPSGEKRTGDFEIPPLLEGQHISLCETLDRVLNTGVVVHGDITISVANIDLIYIGLRALLTSVETARQAGINHITFKLLSPNFSSERVLEWEQLQL